MTYEVLRLAAFPFEGAGGNPAGVVLQAEGFSDAEMRQIAADVGYSETVFVTAQIGPRLRVRYFSPELEVDFCGHATIAAGVALGQSAGAGRYIFETNTGDVDVDVTEVGGIFTAELTSRVGQISEVTDDLLAQLLRALGWSRAELSRGLRPMVANAGNSHPILVLESVETLQTLDYDFEALQAICREQRWPTVQLVAQESAGSWQSRNPFAFGGVYEDPATGSAAAALGVYLRETGALSAGDTFVIKQGFAMGQPCLLAVEVGEDYCRVAGTAVPIGADPIVGDAP